MMTSSNGNIFRVTGPLCGEFTGPGEFPTQRPVTRSFDVFFDLRLNKRLSKQPWGWWFETLSWSLWRQCNGGFALDTRDAITPPCPHRKQIMLAKELITFPIALNKSQQKYITNMRTTFLFFVLVSSSFSLGTCISLHITFGITT